MYVEQRIYTLKPGCIAQYFSLYETKGMAAQARYLPNMLGYYASEVGDLNEVIHLWGHDSLDGREANREKMRADQEFQAYWQEVRQIIVRQRTLIMKPAPFFVDRLARMMSAA
ncbi:NIPSNAP family protein [Novosphingobium sp. MMS21-SN21R]|uniref:NIPSNAP family protein n=1 Tax=Novosphingobium sp. MMS21-SN21R TaxID=2969298 RepID=UPI002886CBF0|nr:NIPSNAP family protein [Novosphingobium sp. MMS21-SN21R]MDT0510259.1 NIPSNAP family protein [Novosphingobium sp. MMS21-SN21R]